MTLAPLPRLSRQHLQSRQLTARREINEVVEVEELTMLRRKVRELEGVLPQGTHSCALAHARSPECRRWQAIPRFVLGTLPPNVVPSSSFLA